MTDFQNQVISLIKSAFLNKNEVTEEISDWSEIIRFALRHQIVSLIYYGVIYSGINVPKDDLQILENMALKNMSVDLNQIYAIKCLEEEFNHNQIDYMLLKGSVLKHVYPKTDMRTMGDIDILIRTEQYEKISDTSCHLTIREGKYHEIKMIFESLGDKVVYLKRLRMKNLRLDETLKPGQYRPLTDQEIEDLKEGMPR